MIGRVSLLVVALCCCSVLAQVNEHIDFQAADLSLSNVSPTWVNPSLHSEQLATTIGNVIPGGDCVQNVHDVLNINQAAGSYFSVIITPETGRSLSVVTNTWDIIESDGGTFVGSTGSCTGATTCEFFYYCEDYSTISAATVRVFSSKAETTDSSITYDLSFRQFTEAIATIDSSRTLTQSSAVDNPFLTTNPGPQNFVQYYHDLDASLAEESASGRLYVEVNGFNSVTGTAYVCVSNDGLVSYNGALSSITEGSDDIDNDPVGNINSSVNTPAGCPLTCNSDNLAGDGSVVVVFDACSSATNCGFDPDLFIGVIPPSAGSTYTVTVRFRSVSIPSVVSVTSSLFDADGELTDSAGFCDGTIGDFSCDNYYELVNAGGFLSSVDPARGPYVRADIFGVYDGVISAELTDGNLAGTESLCAGCQVLDSCTNICSDGTCPEVECYLMAFPCDWNSQLTNEWVVTVSGDTQNDANDFIEYGIEIEVGEFPLDTVLPNIDSFSLGSVVPRSYHHYQVTFTSDDIFDDSLFAVELYSNSEQEDVRLIWRYNNVADDGTCLGFDGMCNTNDSPDGSFCRFEFLCCPIANSYSSYVDLQGENYNDYYNNQYFGAPDDDDFDYTGIPDDTNLSDNGLKVAELRAGTYYFAVQGGVQQNLVSRQAIDYTISWTFTRSVPIYDLVTSLHHVYNGDYSPQFYIDIPADDDIRFIEVRVSDVTNGAVRAFLNCGELAGECPCWEASSTCEAGERDLLYSTTNGEPFMECSLFASGCTCTGQRLYVSVLGIENGFENLQSSYVNPYLSSEDYSIGFALTAIINRVDESLISTIEASRAVTTVSGSIDTISTIPGYLQYLQASEYPYSPYDGSEFRYFLVDFSNVELSGLDSFAVKVSAISQASATNVEYFADYYDSDLVDVSVAPYLDSFPSTTFTSCDPSAAAFCVASLNDPYNQYANFYSEKTSGSCEIVLQPCVNDPGCFSDEDLEFRQDQSSFTASKYFITIENTHDFGATTGYISPNTIHFTVSTQVIDQSPVALTADVPVAATVRGRSYQHFSFAVSSAPANSRLVAEFYQHHDQSRFGIVYFMNFVADGEDVVLAGPSFHCYDSDFACDTCVTDVDTPFCSYEVSPCNLAGQSGTYYLSAALFTSSFFDDLAEFTIKVHFVPTIELLEGGNQGLLEASSVLSRQTAFYSVTVPALTVPADNIIGRIVDIDVEVPLYNSYDVTEGIFVTITQEQPSEFCNCINAGHFVAQQDDINWSRYSCELTGGETYYVSVQGGQDDDDFDQMSFVVHAKLRDVIEIPVALTNDGLDARVIGEYSNIASTSPEFGTVVDHDQFIAFSFDVNGNAGSTLNFEVSQDPQGSIPTTIEVYITQGDFYSPNGGNDGADIGPNPSRANCVPTLASCVGTLEAGNECQLSIDPCDLVDGVYFITISGESLPLGVSSQAINVHVVLTTPGTLNTPTDGVTPVTSSISFTDDIFGSYGVGYFVTANLGLAAASELEFSYAGNAVSMSVSYGSETNADLSCGSTCSDVGNSPSCDVIACNAVNNDVWFIGIDAGGAATANTFTITPSAGPAGDLTSAGTITTTSGVSSFTALGTDEWRYHTYTVQASTSSHYELVSSLSANDIFYVDAADVFRPNLVVNGVDEVAMQSDGSTGTQCTNFATGFFDEATCCYPSITQVFAVVGNVGAYTLELEFVEFIDSVQSLSLGQSSGSQVLTNSQIDWYRVEVPAGQHIYFDFEVTDGEGELYLNRGQQAGSDAAQFNPTAGGDFGSCWDNSGLVDAILVSTCNVGSDCNGFIAACDSCLDTDFQTTFTFAVIPSGNTYTETVTYSLLVVGQVPTTTLALNNNNNLQYPTSSLMVDDRQSNDPDAIYQFYEYEFNTPLADIAGWVPVEDDSAIDDDFDYPHVRFVIDNVRDSTGAAVTNQFPLDVFISSSPFPGNTNADGCYGGRDITSGAGAFPCIENASGAAFSNATVIECSVSVCDMACGQTLYFSVSRSTSDTSDEQYSFDIDIINEFDLLDDFNIVQASVGTTSVTTDFDTSYIFINLAGFNDWQSTGAPQVLEVLFDNIQDTVTTLQIETVPQFSCVQEPIATDCTISSTGTASCELIYDPCTTQDALASIEELVFRVRRTAGTVAFTFDVTTTLITIDPFDATINNVDVGSPYQHTKEIFDGEWQFFEFEVNPNNNYYWMTVDIAAVCCADTTDDLEVYYSWVSSGADVTDVTRRKRWPSDSCAVTDVSLALNGADSNDILDFCVFNGGTFRISIFAQPGLQLFPEFPVTYSIDINVLETVPVVVAPECFDTRITDASWTGYYEIPIDAENRGTELFISMSMSSMQGGDVTLHVSNGPTPFSRGTNSQCDWAALGNEPLTAAVTDYYCVAEVGETSCEIAIPACEFRTGTYYLFVEDNGILTSTAITIGSHIDRKYIPVANLSASAPTVSWDGMVNGFYQYYRVNANDGAARFLLQATATSLACTDADCDYVMYLIDGEVGFAAGANIDGDERSPHGSSCGNFENCFDEVCTFSEGGSCSLEECALSNDVAYIGIRTTSEGHLCKYNLAVNVQADVENLEVGKLTCSTIVGVADHWLVVDNTGTALSFAESTLSISIEVGDDSDNLSVYIGNGFVPGSECDLTSFACTTGSTCTFDVQCLGGNAFLSIYPDTPTVGCSDNTYAITVTRTPATIQTLSIGQTSTGTSSFASSASATSFVYQANNIASYSTTRFSDGNADNDCRVNCPSNTPVLVEAITGSPTYYFSGAAGMVLEQVTPVSLSTQQTPVTFSAGAFGNTFAHFVVDMPAGVTGYTVHFTDVDHCACDGDLSALDFHFYSSDIAPPFSECNACDSGVAMTTGGCDSSFSDFQVSCHTGSSYISISSCDVYTCDVTFNAYVTFDDAATAITGGTHTGAFSTFISDNVACDAAQSSYEFFVDVTDILSVTAREPHGGSTYDVSVSIETTSCGAVDDCTASTSESGEQASCSAGGGCRYSCQTAGRYLISVDTTGADASFGEDLFELQVVNAWEPLSGSVSSTIQGDTRHFYEVTNSGGSIQIDLEVAYGPAIEFDVFTGCGSSPSTSFNEYQVCAAGFCSVYIPTEALAPSTASYFIVLSSAQLSSGPANNLNSEKDTSYTLTVFQGAANCGAPPSTGFCADPAFEGINAFAGITSSTVWNFDSNELRDDEAECRFNELTERCPRPTAECRQWLKIFSCLESFPQCDANGFQLGTCSDVCAQVEAACGTWLLDDPHPEWGCMSGRYVADSLDSTCHTTPTPTPTPETFPPVQTDEQESALTPIVVPDFSTIVIQLPSEVDVSTDFSGDSPVSYTPDGDIVSESGSDASTVTLSVLVAIAALFLVL